jgi:monoamine oxidase
MHAPGLPFPTWWTLLPLRLPVLTGWAGGPRGSELAGKSEKEILDVGIRSLAQCFATSSSWIALRIETHWLANWPADPFARGAYSYVGTGGLPAAQRFYKLGQNILFFAGEHTEAAQIGTVAAAIASADRIAAVIQRQVEV